MELGAILEHIKLLPNQAQKALLSELKLTDANYNVSLGSGIRRALSAYPAIELIDEREGNVYQVILHAIKQ